MYEVHSRSFKTFSGETFTNFKEVQGFNCLQNKILRLQCTFVVSHQLFREGSIEIIQCEGIRGPCYSLLHHLNVFKGIAPEVLLQFREHPKVTGSKSWTIWRVKFWCPSLSSLPDCILQTRQLWKAVLCRVCSKSSPSV